MDAAQVDGSPQRAMSRPECRHARGDRAVLQLPREDIRRRGEFQKPAHCWAPNQPKGSNRGVIDGAESQGRAGRGTWIPCGGERERDIRRGPGRRGWQRDGRAKTEYGRGSRAEPPRPGAHLAHGNGAGRRRPFRHRLEPPVRRPRPADHLLPAEGQASHGHVAEGSSDRARRPGLAVIVRRRVGQAGSRERAGVGQNRGDAVRLRPCQDPAGKREAHVQEVARPRPAFAPAGR